MSEFSFSSTAEAVTEGLSLAGKTVLITGVNSGLGQESARVLALRGAFIVGAARTVEKAQAALAEAGAEGHPVACDLSEPKSVAAAVAAVEALGRPLDVILCNAGIMALPELVLKHGIELQFLTNHLGHFGLVTGLLDSQSADGRVVVVSSGAHWMAPKVGIDFENLSGQKSYDPWKHYGQSKLANLFFARSLAARFEGTQRVAASLHPGVIRTGLGRYNPTVVDDMLKGMSADSIKTVPQGAATQCLLAAHPSAADAAGRYYSDCQLGKISKAAQDDAMAEALWQFSEDWFAQATA